MCPEPSAFQVGTDLELFLQAPGNEDFDLEQVRSWELGWSGVFNGATLVTVDYYRSQNDDFNTNLGNVDAQGADVSLNHLVAAAWTFQFSYSWFDHEIAQGNSPEHKASAGIRYAGGRFDGDLAKADAVDCFEQCLRR